MGRHFQTSAEFSWASLIFPFFFFTSITFIYFVLGVNTSAYRISKVQIFIPCEESYAARKWQSSSNLESESFCGIKNKDPDRKVCRPQNKYSILTTPPPTTIRP